MHSYWWSFVASVSPGIALGVAGLLAAVPPYVLLRQPGRGRARSAVSYLCGLAAGLAATALLAALLDPFTDVDALIGAGLAGAFFCPFVGMARAKWAGPRKRPRGVAMARGVAPQS
jgi:predicted lysophospholipase L1 biosynthesis ABC-type transport system permease subunit